MKELKFRYRIRYSDGSIKKHYFTIEDIEDHKGLSKGALKNAHVEILSRDRYSELTDKHGEEIYENDIIEWRCDSAALARNKMFAADQVIFTCGEFTTKSEMTLIWSKGNSCSKEGKLGDVEIIGDVYENPELIRREDSKKWQ